MMKKLLLSLTCFGLMVGYTSASTNVSTSLFNAGEVGVSLGTAYNVKPSEPFSDPYSFNLVAGVHYFPTKLVGAEVNVPFYQTKGVSVDEVQAGLLLRVPVGHLGPYVGVGGVYNWNAEEDWAYIAKLGAEWRFNSKWGVFVEGQYRENDFQFDNGEVSVKGGVRLNF